MAKSTQKQKIQDSQVNLHSVAEECGVSVMTASRALNGSSYVAAKTREKILAVAKRLGYDPARNQMARQMVLRRHGITALNHTIGLFFPPLFTRNPAAAYYGPIFDCIMTVAVLKRYSVHTNYISYPHSEEEPVTELIESLNWSSNIDEELFPYDMIESLPAVFCHGDIDGTLLQAKPHEQSYIVNMLRAESNFFDRPIVTIIEPTDGCSAVLTDDASSAYLAMQHLIELGHRHFLHFPEQQSQYYCYQQRLAGYGKALKEAGIDTDSALYACPWDWDYPITSMTAFNEFLVAHPQITAVFAHHDYMAQMIYNDLKQQGISVPEDISLVGHDDSFPVLDPVKGISVTTTNLPLADVGREATRMLIRQITENNKEIHRIILPTTFIPRNSTGPVRKVNT
jgi:DNA-binding LacI/PurR family transcriptional regulator